MKRLTILLITILLGISVFCQTFHDSLSATAIELTHQKVIYDPSYYAIDYPNGDIPIGRGVCTDVIIRAYRSMGIDLQKEVHEDMNTNFTKYPKIWGHRSTDKNIDHRRVPNLMTYFQIQGAELPISTYPEDYLPGDVVCWNLGDKITHIGIVVSTKSSDLRRNRIVHNIGQGQVMEDCLFDFKIIGHYRYPVGKD